MSQGSWRVASTPHPAGETTIYDGNRAYGDAIQFNGDINGDVHFPERPREAGEPSPNQCLRDLLVTDPREDRARIESGKDRLLRDCYAWILEDTSFRLWRSQDATRLLWIRGDPGKGKTMMTMGVIAELSQPESSYVAVPKKRRRIDDPACLLSFFFCQSTVPGQNNAVAVLRGLIYMLVLQKRELLKYVQERHRILGKQLFEGSNALYALQNILSDMLNDAALPLTYLLVDGLDECTSGMPELLQIITSDSVGRQSRVKWLVTSRNIPEIEQYLQPDSLGIQLSLEVEASQVSRAVAAFVDYKVQRLLTVRKYSTKLQAEIQQQLRDKAEGTFLWVSMVCKELEKVPLYRTREVLQTMPRGLNPLYDRMMAQIAAQDAETTDTDYCWDILRSTTLAFRPLKLEELAIAADLPKDLCNDVQAVVDLVSRCGSFLTVRHGVVSFIHLSAKDYFTLGNGRQVFEGTWADKHRYMADCQLDAMERMLRRDVCSLHKSGARAHDESTQERIKNSNLSTIKYACEYWVEHVQAGGQSCSSMLVDDGKVHRFFKRHVLHWLEAMSLLQRIPEAILALQNLEAVVKSAESVIVSKIVHDALRFAMWAGSGIQEAPLQVYYGALVFAPKQSIVRQQFQGELPEGVGIRLGLKEEWGSLLQALEGHHDTVCSVAFSHDSTRLASASWDRTIMTWDTSSGACLQILESHSDAVNSVAFSHNSSRLASASHDKTVKIWDAFSGACLQTLEGHSAGVFSVTFSHNSNRLASASHDKTAKIWDTSSNTCLHTLEGHREEVYSVAFSHNSTRLASASLDKTVKIWDAISGACLQTLEGHSDGLFSVAFSHDSTRLASASEDGTVKTWDTSSNMCLQTLEGHREAVYSVAFSHDSTRLASASDDSTLKIWDASSGACLQTFEGHSDGVSSVAFSHSSARLASASLDRTVKIWDTSINVYLQTLEGHSDEVNSVAFSSDSTRLASASWDKTVKIWDAISGACLQTLEGHSVGVLSVVFSHDSARLASASDDMIVKIWDAISGAYVQTLEGNGDDLVSVLASLHPIKTVTEPHQPVSREIMMSADGAWISNDAQKELWLPTEYRGSCSAISGKCVGIGTRSGKVWICQLE